MKNQQCGFVGMKCVFLPGQGGGWGGERCSPRKSSSKSLSEKVFWKTFCKQVRFFCMYVGCSFCWLVTTWHKRTGGWISTQIMFIFSWLLFLIKDMDSVSFIQWFVFEMKHGNLWFWLITRVPESPFVDSLNRELSGNEHLRITVKSIKSFVVGSWAAAILSCCRERIFLQVLSKKVRSFYLHLFNNFRMCKYEETIQMKIAFGNLLAAKPVTST